MTQATLHKSVRIGRAGFRGGMRGPKRQGGMTLVEFMVGITIGLLVVLAAVSSLIMIRGSARSLGESAGLEQKISLILLQIGQQIKQTGAINATSAGTDGNISFVLPANAGVNSVNQAAPIMGTDGTGNAFDTLTVGYAVPNDGSSSINCIGLTPSDGSSVISQFSVNAAGDLRCSNGSTTQPIAGNVVDFRVKYLIYKNNNIVYQTATQNNQSTADWGNITGVQICLGMKGEPAGAPSQTVTDCQGNTRNTPSDGRIYRYVKQIFYLRN